MIHDNCDHHESCDDHDHYDDHGDLDTFLINIITINDSDEDHAGAGDDDDDDLHINRRTFFLRLVLILTYKKGWIMLMIDYVRIILVRQ